MKLVRMLVALGAVVAAAAALAVSSASAQSAQTLQLLSVQQHQSFVDMAPGQKPVIGSRLFFNDAIYNRAAQFGKPSGARVGTAEGTCTIVTMGAAQCFITAHMPNGELVAAGKMTLVRGLATNRFAVLGGLGAYSSSRGSVLSKDLSPTRTVLAIHLNG
jgi:hypothetical protein